MSKIINRVREQRARAAKVAWHMAEYERNLEREKGIEARKQNESRDSGGGMAAFILIAVLCIAFAIGYVQGSSM